MKFRCKCFSKDFCVIYSLVYFCWFVNLLLIQKEKKLKKKKKKKVIRGLEQTIRKGLCTGNHVQNTRKKSNEDGEDHKLLMSFWRGVWTLDFPSTKFW